MEYETATSQKAGIRTILVVALVVALALFSYMNYTKRMQLAKELQQSTQQLEQLKSGDNPQNVEAAKQIVDRVRKLITIPNDVDPTVATIVDVNALKSKNEFYKNAKNGDHLIITPTRAILYDPQKNIIIDVVPVQLQAPAQPAK